MKLGQPLLLDEAAQIGTQPLESVSGTIVGAHFELSFTREIQQARHLAKSAGDAKPIELAFGHRLSKKQSLRRARSLHAVGDLSTYR